MRTLAAVLLLLAVFGASTQCVADCLVETQQKVPPCHGKSSPAPCKHSQLVANTQTAADQPVILVAHPPHAVDPSEAYVEAQTPAATLQSSHDQSITVLRL